MAMKHLLFLRVYSQCIVMYLMWRSECFLTDPNQKSPSTSLFHVPVSVIIRVYSTGVR